MANPPIKRPPWSQVYPDAKSNPLDFLRKGTKKGTYIGWQTGNNLLTNQPYKPDFGKGENGPGIPYREVEKNYSKESWANKPKIDAKTAAIRRRLSNGQA